MARGRRHTRQAQPPNLSLFDSIFYGEGEERFKERYHRRTSPNRKEGEMYFQKLVREVMFEVILTGQLVTADNI